MSNLLHYGMNHDKPSAALYVQQIRAISNYFERVE